MYLHGTNNCSPDFFSRGCSSMGCRVGASLKEFMLIVLEHVISASMFLNLSLMIAVFPVPVATHAYCSQNGTLVFIMHSQAWSCSLGNAKGLEQGISDPFGTCYQLNTRKDCPFGLPSSRIRERVLKHRFWLTGACGTPELLHLQHHWL